jgi:hypothetical protein
LTPVDVNNALSAMGGQSIRSTGGGIIGADAGTNWREQPVGGSRHAMARATSMAVEDVVAEMIASVLSAVAIAANSQCWPVRL